MILDTALAFSTAQDLTADAASESYLDLSVARNIGKGEPMAAVVFVSTTLDTAAEGGTLDVTVQTDDNTGFNSPTTIATAPQRAESTLAAGCNPIVIPIPTFYTAEQYMRLYYNVNNADAFTSGAVEPSLMRLSDIQSNV